MSMRRSDDRIFVTHVGSLSRPPDLLAAPQGTYEESSLAISNRSDRLGPFRSSCISKY